MPVLKRQYDHVKVFRPSGALYADGDSLTTPEVAIADAQRAFIAEFGRAPVQSKVVFEIVGVTAKWVATVYEIEE
jgi:hypothetical protein